MIISIRINGIKLDKMTIVHRLSGKDTILNNDLVIGMKMMVNCNTKETAMAYSEYLLVKSPFLKITESVDLTLIE